MRDPGERKADASQAEIEKRLRSVYEQAAKDIIARLDRYARQFTSEDRRKRKQLESGEITQKQYNEWLNGQIFRKRLWEDQVAGITSVIMTANEQANRIVEGERAAVFAENATYQAYKMEHDANVDLGFSVYSSEAVTRLLRNNPSLLPPREIDPVRDAAWNRKLISSIIARSIVSGAKLDDVAEILGRELGNSNKKAMLRYSRTAMTAAMNAGREEAMNDALDMGIKVRKTWIAVLDERTRPAHQELDGQVREVNEPFSSMLGPIMYPGDPSAAAANIWNCRCKLGYDYADYPSSNRQRWDNKNKRYINDMTYREWKEWAS